MFVFVGFSAIPFHYNLTFLINNQPVKLQKQHPHHFGNSLNARIKILTIHVTVQVRAPESLQTQESEVDGDAHEGPFFYSLACAFFVDGFHEWPAI